MVTVARCSGGQTDLHSRVEMDQPRIDSSIFYCIDRRLRGGNINDSATREIQCTLTSAEEPPVAQTPPQSQLRSHLCSLQARRRASDVSSDEHFNFRWHGLRLTGKLSGGPADIEPDKHLGDCRTESMTSGSVLHGQNLTATL